MRGDLGCGAQAFAVHNFALRGAFGVQIARSGTSFKNRYCTWCSAWVATKVPLPCLRTSKCSLASSSMALRTVPWLTR
jgi:hypothetical protein